MTGEGRPQPLAPAQRWLALATGLAGTALAGLGGFESYGAVEQVAVAHHFAHPAGFPLGVDTAVVALFLAELLLAWLDMPFPPLRWGAWALVGATIWWNAAASAGNVLGMAMHASAPLLVVVWIESIRHAVRVRAQMAARRHIERSPLARWLLAPVATARMWRAQCLWNVTSYAEAIALDRRRLLVKARLRDRYGWTRHGFFWWALAPAKERIALRLGLEDRLVAGQDEPPSGTGGLPPAPGALPPPARPAPRVAAPTVRRDGRGDQRGDRTAKAREYVQALRDAGGARPSTYQLAKAACEHAGLARSSRIQDLVLGIWPEPATATASPNGQGSAP